MEDEELDNLKALFLQECGENLDTLENGLLRLCDGERNDELLNEVFRAAHSIKGGGASLGFDELAALTHHMETLLEGMRAGTREIYEKDLEVLLQSVDVLRALLVSSPVEGSPEYVDFMHAQEQLQIQLAVGTDQATDEPEASSESAEKSDVFLQVDFKPFEEFMSRGNDPVLLVRELHFLGDASSTLNCSDVPTWDSFDPRTCYLSWQTTFEQSVQQSEIEEIFEWVSEFDCSLNISEYKPNSSDEVSDETAITSDSPASNPTQEASTETPTAKDPEVKPPAKKATPSTPPPKAPVDSTIRISTEKIDELINLVGELVITQSMLAQSGAEEVSPQSEFFQERMNEQARNIRELQDSVMRVRMLPLSYAFNRLPRLVHDLSKKLGKKVDMKTEGEGTELDKTVLESIIDPLVHLVRNSLDHGLETPEQRAAAGKPEAGSLVLRASQRGGTVLIEIIDDGRGVNREHVYKKAVESGIINAEQTLNDEEIDALIFAPGFSTAEEVTDLSGRGVGMDVVRRNINDLNGQVDIQSSPGQGTTITIRLPLTLAILDGQVIDVAGQQFILPILSLIETIETHHAGISALPEAGEVCRFRGQHLPLVRMRTLLGIDTDSSANELVIILEARGMLIGVVIDEVVSQQQVVIKALDSNYKTVHPFTGATIMSDGSVALIIDPGALAPNRNRHTAVAA